MEVDVDVKLSPVGFLWGGEAAVKATCSHISAIQCQISTRAEVDKACETVCLGAANCFTVRWCRVSGHRSRFLGDPCTPYQYRPKSMAGSRWAHL